VPRHVDPSDDAPDAVLPAGPLSAWLQGMESALRGEEDSDVPCGGCTACCTSSQFIHIEPDEVATKARIPLALQFPAPRMPPGHVVLPFDEHGHCPMLVDDACSIYAVRPRTCRTYDCRVFPASGVEITDAAQRAIARRAARWRFEHPTTADAIAHASVRAAATYVREQGNDLPAHVAPVNATQAAVLAVRLHGAFLGREDPDPVRLSELLTVEAHADERRGRAHS
jgi:Fe-S-cluster containining protein